MKQNYFCVKQHFLLLSAKRCAIFISQTGRHPMHNAEFERHKREEAEAWAAKLASETPEERRERLAFKATCMEESRLRVADRMGEPLDAYKANLAAAIEEHEAAVAALKDSQAKKVAAA
jgi:hypothetical protein